MNVSLEDSIAACRRLTREAHSSFVPAFSLLPKDKQEAMEILYAFDRFTDDLVDNSSDTKTKEQQLYQWRGILDTVFSSADFSDFETLSKENADCKGLIFLPALKHITARFNIPVYTYFQLTAGMEADIEPQLFATFGDAAKYCHQAATSVGTASLAIWGTIEPLDSPQIVKAAGNCGLAFQWTNILRDILEDCCNGRIYLPVDELNRFGFTPDSFSNFVSGKGNDKCGKDKNPLRCLTTTVNSETNFINLLGLQLERCAKFYRQAVPLYELISEDSRDVFAMMFMRYYKLFQKIKNNPSIVLKKRVRLSRFEKITLFLCGKFNRFSGFPHQIDR
ncbi:squalene synthase HpnD [Planctomycetales bacterium]|nr:squalene synthase HpnD [Planctomycetales bacterium]